MRDIIILLFSSLLFSFLVLPYCKSKLCLAIVASNRLSSHTNDRAEIETFSDTKPLTTTTTTTMGSGQGPEEGKTSQSNTSLVPLDEETRYKHQAILLQSGMIHQIMHVLKSPFNVMLIPWGVRICKKIKRHLWRNFRLFRPKNTGQNRKKARQNGDNDNNNKTNGNDHINNTDNDNDNGETDNDNDEERIKDNISDLSDTESEIDASLFKIIRIYQVLNRYNIFEAMIKALMQDSSVSGAHQNSGLIHSSDPVVLSNTDDVNGDISIHINGNGNGNMTSTSSLSPGNMLYSHLDVIKEYLEMIDALVDTNRYSKPIPRQYHQQKGHHGGAYTPDTPHSNTFTPIVHHGGIMESPIYDQLYATPHSNYNYNYNFNHVQNPNSNQNQNQNQNYNSTHNNDQNDGDNSLTEQQQHPKDEDKPRDNGLWDRIKINNQSYALEYASKHGQFVFWLLNKLTHLLKYVSHTNHVSAKDTVWVRTVHKKKVMSTLMRVVMIIWRLSVYHKPASHLVSTDGVVTIINASRYIQYSATYGKRVLLLSHYLKIICNMLGSSFFFFLITNFFDFLFVCLFVCFLSSLLYISPGADKRTWRDLTDTDGYHVLKAVIGSLHLGGKEAQTMESDWILFEQAIVDKCLPLAIEYMNEFNLEVAQQLTFLTMGTVMCQHTMSAPLSVRARLKMPPFPDQDHGNTRNGKDKRNRKQHATHNINIRIELLPRGHRRRGQYLMDKGNGTETDEDDKERRKMEEEEERLIAKHLKKISNTEKAHSSNTSSSPGLRSEDGEMYEHFPMEWVENILPGNKHILLSNCDKNNCFMIVYLYVFQSIKLKRKHVCLECLSDQDCRVWTHALQQLLQFS
ncbi:hypothetical protein RFI_07204 [Reticulomyxa filosa]|uniref:PH domain-containing protein n=1 Tax=Reticulomyxa filosa TaxID=46433 RepID=X6NVL6_RETFI|nr:hypothetical protein RFI_07204 [Reticulomyxa filosa]|eukprot:ETO29913.1 hypothetical protein RFI_07204 [Reticulomyxa filosa]